MKSKAPLTTSATGQTGGCPRPARIAIDVPVSFTLEAEISTDLDALADQYEAIQGKPRTWTKRLHQGGTHTETCTTWCTSGHRGDIESAGGSREDIWHRLDVDGVELPIGVNLYEAVDMPVLTGSLTVSPYSEDHRRRVPTAAVEILEGEWVEHLDPDGLQAVIDKVRSQADRLQAMHAQLVQARAEWTGGQA